VVTDHNLRYPENISLDQQRTLYAEMKHHGIDSIRFDWDWKEIMPSAHGQNPQAISRYVQAMGIMKEVGMEPPVLVLSNPPDWAVQLYKTNKGEFFKAYSEYINLVGDSLHQAGLGFNSAQIFNEINHVFLFKFVSLEDLSEITKIAREGLSKAQSDVKLSTSLIVSNVNDLLAKAKGLPTTSELLGQQKKMLKDNFDIVSLDYYPGVWHRPGFNPKKVYKQLDAIKEVFVELDRMGLDFEIGEVGFPSNEPYNTEKNQRYFYDVFFKEFRKMLADFKVAGVRLPQWVGLYESQDEANVAFGGMAEKILSIPGVSKVTALAFNPEHDFGLENKAGEAKGILKGRRAGPKQSFRRKKFKDISGEELSRLAEIIRYVNRPFTKDEIESAKERSK
jgi:hypothetical protein